MSDNTNNDAIVLVQFDPAYDDVGGTVKVSNVTVEKLVEDSKTSKVAVTNALNTIQWVIDEVKQVREKVDIVDRPNTMELEFGIKITTKAGVIVAGVEGEFHIKAKLVWNKDS